MLTIVELSKISSGNRSLGIVNYKIKRIPKNYEGLEPTGREIKDLLGPILYNIQQTTHHSPKELLDYWPKLVGEKVASMTQAISIEEGNFFIKVKSSTLYSLLSQEKPRLLKKIQETFPQFKVKKLVFQIG